LSFFLLSITDFLLIKPDVSRCFYGQQLNNRPRKKIILIRLIND